MDAHVLRGLVAVFTAAVGAFLVVRAVYDWRRRREMKRRTWTQENGEDARSGDMAHTVLWRMRNGVTPLKPLTQRVMRIPRIRLMLDEAVDLIALQGVVTTPVAFGSSCLAVAVVLFIVGSLLAGTPICGLAIDACLVIGLAALLKRAHDSHEAAMRDAVPDALRSLSACFRAGLTLQQTMQRVSEEIQGPLVDVFKSAALRLRTGCSAGESLAVFREHDSIRELSFVAVALDVQHVSGGSIEGVLDSARESVQSEIDLRRSLKVQTAQAQLSARIVTLMPFVLIALFSLISEDFLAPFFESFAGMALLTIALLMQLTGVYAVRSMLKVDGV